MTALEVINNQPPANVAGVLEGRQQRNHGILPIKENPRSSTCRSSDPEYVLLRQTEQQRRPTKRSEG
jgi:hypothetical protein